MRLETVANFHPTPLLFWITALFWTPTAPLLECACLLHRPPRTLRKATNHSPQLQGGKAPWEWKRIFIYETHIDKDVWAAGKVSTWSPITNTLTFRRNLKVRKYRKTSTRPWNKAVSRSKSKEQVLWAIQFPPLAALPELTSLTLENRYWVLLCCLLSLAIWISSS